MPGAAEAVCTVLRAAFVAEEAYLGPVGIVEADEMAEHETRRADLGLDAAGPAQELRVFLEPGVRLRKGQT